MAVYTIPGHIASGLAPAHGGRELSWREQLAVAAVLSVLLTLEGLRFVLVNAANLLVLWPWRLLAAGVRLLSAGGQLAFGHSVPARREKQTLHPQAQH